VGFSHLAAPYALSATTGIGTVYVVLRECESEVGSAGETFVTERGYERCIKGRKGHSLNSSFALKQRGCSAL
jgi:hypothetical protein